MVGSTLWKKASCLGLVLLLGSTFAGRLNDVARRRGFHPDTIRDMEHGIRGIEKEKRDSRRYYNSKTKPYFVEKMPEVPQEYLTEMYSGLMPIDTNDTSRALFFVFQPTVGDPVDEVTIWMNGGPGCSSLEGFLQETGLIRWTWGQYVPQINPYSWVNLTNVLWVEQPVGTGFSIGKVTATNEDDVAADFVKFFKNFEQTFGIKNYKIYVTGESYAGRYVPYISNAMLDQNDTTYFDLSGALMYDPCIGSFDIQSDMTIYPFAEANNNVLGYNSTFLEQMAGYHESCGYASFLEEYLVFPPSGMQPDLDGPAADNCALWNEA